MYFTASDHCIKKLVISQYTQENDTEVSPFKFDERLLYTNEGHTLPVYLRNTEQSAGGAAKFTVEFPSRKLITTSRNHLWGPSHLHNYDTVGT